MLIRQRRIQPPDEIFLQCLRIKAVIINRLLERIFAPRHPAALHLSHCFHGTTLQCIGIHQLRTAKLPLQWSAQIQHNLNVFRRVIELGRCQFFGAPVAGLEFFVEFTLEVALGQIAEFVANFAGSAIADQLGRQHRAANSSAQMNVVLSEPADVKRGVVGKPMPGGVAKATHLTTTHWLQASGF